MDQTFSVFVIVMTIVWHKVRCYFWVLHAQHFVRIEGNFVMLTIFPDKKRPQVIHSFIEVAVVAFCIRLVILWAFGI